MAEHEHDWQPIDRMPAAYRCSSCGAMGYKAESRRAIAGNTAGPNWGSNKIQLYKCHHKECDQPVVVIWPWVRAVKKHKPSCQAHRPDKVG